MRPFILLASLVASVTASNYTFPDGFDLNQVKPTDKGIFPTSMSTPYAVYIQRMFRADHLQPPGVWRSAIPAPRSAVEPPRPTPVIR